MFDGHGGVDAAIYASIHLHVNMVHQEMFQHDPAEALCRAFRVTDERFVQKAAREVRGSKSINPYILPVSGGAPSTAQGQHTAVHALVPTGGFPSIASHPIKMSAPASHSIQLLLRMPLQFSRSPADQAQSLGSLTHRCACQWQEAARAAPAVPSSWQVGPMPGMSRGKFVFSQIGSEGLLVSSHSRRESTACSSLGIGSVLQFQHVLSLS